MLAGPSPAVNCGCSLPRVFTSLVHVVYRTQDPRLAVDHSDKPVLLCKGAKKRWLEGMIMDTSLGLRIEGWSRDAAGHLSSPPAQRRAGRKPALIQLLEALEAGDMDHARVVFSQLVHLDPTLAHHALLTRIGAALQSSNLVAAQHFARELRDEGLQAWSAQVHALQSLPDGLAVTATPVRKHHPHPTDGKNIRATDGRHIIDCRA